MARLTFSDELGLALVRSSISSPRLRAHGAEGGSSLMRKHSVERWLEDASQIAMIIGAIALFALLIVYSGQ